MWFDWIDEFRQVSDKTSFMMARRLAREEGILLGGSAGLNVALALDLAREVADPDALIVTILCDTGERYLSKQFNDAWMQENQMLDTPRTTVQELLERRPAGRAGGRERGAGGGGPAGAQPDGTWGVSQIPVLDNGQSVGGLIEGTLMTRALAQPALLERPVSEVMDPPFPEVEAGHADGSGGRDAHAREPGGAGAQGREAGRHREPVRRAAAADRGDRATVRTIAAQVG